MTTLRNALDERKDNFYAHFTLAKALEEHLVAGAPLSIGETPLSAHHLLTMKSALIVHLYNIVEAIMSQAMDEIGEAVKLSSPSDWSNDTLREWLRFYASKGIDGGEDKRLKVVHVAALKLLAKETMEDLELKKPSGSWNDKLIHVFSKRLNVHFPLTEEIARRISASGKYGDKTPLEFLADRRNAIAHGRRTFESGANDLTMADIEELADATIYYMEHAMNAFQSYIDDRKYLADAV
ncbi:MAG: MAE_28990/MAE_18760 family HEPN-like nuclease [Candidatus Thiodiazotropha taylori]